MFKEDWLKVYETPLISNIKVTILLTCLAAGVVVVFFSLETHTSAFLGGFGSTGVYTGFQKFRSAPIKSDVVNGIDSMSK